MPKTFEITVSKEQFNAIISAEELAATMLYVLEGLPVKENYYKKVMKIQSGLDAIVEVNLQKVFFNA